MKKTPVRPVRPARPLAAPQLVAAKGGAILKPTTVTASDDWENPLA